MSREKGYNSIAAGKADASPEILTQVRKRKGPVAHIECLQCIPCDPCAASCPTGAISMGGAIINRPVLDEEKCIGCGMCLRKCSGLAISLIDLSSQPGKAIVELPYEYLPLPRKGDEVVAVDGQGRAVCSAQVLTSGHRPGDGSTAAVSIIFPTEYVQKVKSIKRINVEG